VAGGSSGGPVGGLEDVPPLIAVTGFADGRTKRERPLE
jgi:hypothetical protein